MVRSFQRIVNASFLGNAGNETENYLKAFHTRRDDPETALSRTKRTSRAIEPSSRLDASSPLTCPSFSVRPEARFSAPTRGRPQAAARRSCQGWPPWRPPAGLGLDGSEHGCTLKAVGAEVIIADRSGVSAQGLGRHWPLLRLSPRGFAVAAAGGVTRMCRDAEGGSVARPEGPSDSTRSRPLVAASRPKETLMHRGNSCVSRAQQPGNQNGLYPD